jgi:hypothetical protein
MVVNLLRFIQLRTHKHVDKESSFFFFYQQRVPTAEKGCLRGELKMAFEWFW